MPKIYALDVHFSKRRLNFSLQLEVVCLFEAPALLLILHRGVLPNSADAFLLLTLATVPVICNGVPQSIRYIIFYKTLLSSYAPHTFRGCLGEARF